MASVKGNIAKATGTDRINQFKKSAGKSASVFMEAGPSRKEKNISRRKSLGGKGG